MHRNLHPRKDRTHHPFFHITEKTDRNDLPNSNKISLIFTRFSLLSQSLPYSHKLFLQRSPSLRKESVKEIAFLYPRKTIYTIIGTTLFSLHGSYILFLYSIVIYMIKIYVCSFLSLNVICLSLQLCFITLYH